jgi:nitrous oxide reductase
MPSHDAQHEPAERMSRRSLLQGAAAAGAAGLAVTALGAAVSPAAAAASTTSSAPAHGGVKAPASGDLKAAPSGPVVVHVRNARSGDIEVFSGTSQTSLRDKDLAARIVRAIG